MGLVLYLHGIDVGGVMPLAISFMAENICIAALPAILPVEFNAEAQVASYPGCTNGLGMRLKHR